MVLHHHDITRAGLAPPFQEQHQLTTDIDRKVLFPEPSLDDITELCLPGHPTILLSDTPVLLSFLYSELHSEDLDLMAPFLWLLSQQSSSNISPLHRQIVKYRSIIITEDPRLHLVWNSERIFIKPLPPYLLSHTFWKYFLARPTNCRTQTYPQLPSIRAAALGLLRSYALLIQYESDFAIATRPEARLLPASISYAQLMHLLAAVKHSVDDTIVSPRYTYGELRLARLNFYCKFILGRRHFHRVHDQYGSYFAQYYGPLLFLIGFVSIFLNAMQVEIGVEQVHPGQSNDFVLFCKWFGILTLVFGAILVLVLLTTLAYMFIKEWSYAIRYRLRRAKDCAHTCRLGRSE